MIKVIISDVDGTLIDSNYLHVESFARAFREVGRLVPRSAIHRQIGKGSDQLLPEFLSDESARKLANELHSKYFADLQQQSYPLPGAKELIASLAERGYSVWFSSSAKPHELGYYLEALEAKERIAGVVSSGDVDESKPAGDIFALTLERADCRPDEAIVIGDTIWDVEAALRAGVRTIGVLTGGAFSRAELEAAGAIAVFQDCADLLQSGFPDDY